MRFRLIFISIRISIAHATRVSTSMYIICIYIYICWNYCNVYRVIAGENIATLDEDVNNRIRLAYIIIIMRITCMYVQTNKCIRIYVLAAATRLKC